MYFYFFVKFKTVKFLAKTTLAARQKHAKTYAQTQMGRAKVAQKQQN